MQVGIGSEFLDFGFRAVGFSNVLNRFGGEILGETVIGIVDAYHDARSDFAGLNQAVHDLIDTPLLVVPRRGGVKQHLPVVHVEYIT